MVGHWMLEQSVCVCGRGEAGEEAGGWQASKAHHFSVLPWRMAISHLVSQRKGSFSLKPWGGLSPQRSAVLKAFSTCTSQCAHA